MVSKSRKKFAVVSAVLALLFCHDADAQRHIIGQHVVSVDGMFYHQFGGGISWGRCDRLGRTVYGANFYSGPPEPYTVTVERKVETDQGVKEYDEDVTYDVVSYDIYASGGYVFRVLSSRSRSLSLWVGGTIDTGARVHGSDLHGEGSDQIPTVKHIFGVTPRVELEYFPHRSFALTLHVRPRLQFYSHNVSEKFFYPEFGVGCSFYILD